MSLTKVTYSMISGAPVNVLDYGAVGDGVTDDTAAIQAAIDAVYTAGGGIVFIPSGIYLVATSAGTINLPYDDGTLTAGASAYGPPLSTETPTTMPYCLNLKQGVRLIGEDRLSTMIRGNWTYGVTAINTSQLITLKIGTTTGGITNSTHIEDLAFDTSMIPVLSIGVLDSCRFRNIRMSNCAFALVLQTTERCLYENIQINNTPAGIVHGGWWNWRENSYSSTNIPNAFGHGWTDKTWINQLSYVNSRDHGATEDSIDAFFNTYFFKTANSTTGTGYTSAPTIGFSAGAATATATVDVATGKITAITVNSGGAGYVSAPDVTFSGGGGSGASATALISGGAVVGVAISRATSPITGDTASGFANRAMYRGVTGRAVTLHSRYGRPNFNNSFRDSFVFGAERGVFYGGTPYFCHLDNIYAERIGMPTKSTASLTSNVWGVDYTDPYLGSGNKLPAAIYGLEGQRNFYSNIYTDPIAAIQILNSSSDSDSWTNVLEGTNSLTTLIPTSGFTFDSSSMTRTWSGQGTFDTFREYVNPADTNVTVVGTSAAGTCTYAIRQLSYTRVGNFVFFNLYINYSGHTGTGGIRINGLPYAPNTTGIPPVTLYSISGLAYTGTLSGYIQDQSGSPAIFIRQISEAGAGTTITIPAAAAFTVSGCYQVL